MIRSSNLKLVGVLVVIFGLAAASSTKPHQTSQVSGEDPKLAPQQLREDFQILRKALEEGSSGIYRYVPKKEMDRIFDTAYARIDHPMDALEFYRIAAPVVGAMKDGHTRIGVPADIQNAIDTQVPLFPVDVTVLDDKAYILHDLATNDSRLAGAEILKINGVPTEQMLKTMEAVVHGDGDTATSGPSRLSHKQTFVTSLYTLLGIKPPFQLVYRPLNGKKVESIELQGKTLNVLKDELQQKFPPPPITNLRFLDDSSIAVLKITSFNPKLNHTGPESTHDFIKRAFEQVQSHNSAILILDLRDNGGGEDDLGKLLFSYLTTEPFQYYNDLVVNPAALNYLPEPDRTRRESSHELVKGDDGELHNVGHPNMGIQQPSQPAFQGKVFVLINGGSFSTTSEFLSVLHFHHRATFLGEEAGGGYYGNTSGFGAPVTLPNSHLILGLKMMTYYLAVSGYAHPDRGVMPDYPVRYTIADLLAGTDKDMAQAIELAHHLHK